MRIRVSSTKLNSLTHVHLLPAQARLSSPLEPADHPAFDCTSVVFLASHKFSERIIHNSQRIPWSDRRVFDLFGAMASVVVTVNVTNRDIISTGMPFARPRVPLGLSPRLLSLARSHHVRSVFVARRLLSTSQSSRAEHQTGPLSDVQRGATRDVNPYKDGPSAIDKAVHLFFFTEILRGAETNRSFRGVDIH
jgi:hypothetical protein